MHHFDPRVSPKISPGASSRILYDIPCKVCQDHSSGKHYGIFACDGCAGFFKRSIRRARQYVCKAKAEGSCVVDKTHRNQCRACRLHKCLQAGMNKDAVQHERGPRNSTLRRQLALYLKEPDMAAAAAAAAAAATAAALHSSHVAPMKLLPPTFPLRSVEAVCESAARLLFMNVQWAKSVTAFTALPMNDQLLLLEESWRDLFVVGAAQLMLPLDVSQLAALLGSSRSLALLHQLRLFQEALLRFAHMAVDAHEYACLRTIVLFKTAYFDTRHCPDREEAGLPPADPDTRVHKASRVSAQVGAESQPARRGSVEGIPGPAAGAACLRKTASASLVLRVGLADASLVKAPPKAAADRSARSPLSLMASQGPTRRLAANSGLLETPGRRLEAPEAVCAQQEAQQRALGRYTALARPQQPFRLGKLLLLLPAVRQVAPDTIEELFFRSTIGNIPIHRIICDMYRTGADPAVSHTLPAASPEL
ncbi:nuclear receptor subfamily 2 group E member 1 [Schistocerca cancellata]|uniref:nuclear receptor subfamily 2 group E member 1 n=1 Tax=Schistocerca cancellata TaxID=274614 RepID=UPI0021175CD8|nr:nuclear receptor subfamily 2 group E member 1 [Schistocerca cancellata]